MDNNMELTKEERFLLEWLGKEDYSQYGECHGTALDGLIAKGLAQVHNDPALQRGFIAKGKGQLYQAVSLTEKGEELLSQKRDSQ